MGGAARPAEDRRGATVYIGTKPTMTYVFQVVAELNSGAVPVVVKARGIAIARAVDVVEVVRRRFLAGDVAVGTVWIGTERLVNRDHREANVSAVAIPLTRTVPPPPPPAAPPPVGAAAGSPAAAAGAPTSPPTGPRSAPGRR
ncbi:MAG: DNA-binding protein Alba [Thermoplasmata archaeon]